MPFCFPWAMVGRFENGDELIVTGNDECGCVGRLINLIPEYGDLIWYRGLTDDNYRDGEYIGA